MFESFSRCWNESFFTSTADSDSRQLYLTDSRLKFEYEPTSASFMSPPPSDAVLRQRKQTATPITRNAVRQHVLPDDAWVIHQNRVLDVSASSFKHPGGSVIFTMAGDDCTDIFAAFHPKVR